MQSIVLAGSGLGGGFSVAEKERPRCQLPDAAAEVRRKWKEEEGLKKGSMKDA